MLRFGWLFSEPADDCNPGSPQVPDEAVDVDVLASNPDREMGHSRESMTELWQSRSVLPALDQADQLLPGLEIWLVTCSEDAQAFP